MYKKIIITLLIILAVIVGVIFAFIIQKNEQAENIEQIDLSEKVTDECTEEYEQLSNQISEEANSSEEKISPNCLMILRKNYIGCEHTINEYAELPQELVNMTKEQLQEEYSDWNIDKFSENEIILSKMIEGSCNEHYVLKNVDNKIVVYKIEEDGKETEYLKTEISTEYLTETDKINIDIGLEVHGTENLNMLLEDFE